MPRRDLSWKGQKKPQDGETHVLIEEKSVAVQWPFRLRILAEKMTTFFFFYVIFVLKCKAR